MDEVLQVTLYTGSASTSTYVIECLKCVVDPSCFVGAHGNRTASGMQGGVSMGQQAGEESSGYYHKLSYYNGKEPRGEEEARTYEQ